MLQSEVRLDLRVPRTILASRCRMQFQEHAQTVLPCPLDSEKDVVPRGLRQERFTRPDVDSPVRHRKADPVETCSCNLSEVLLRLRIDEHRDRKNIEVGLTMKVL